MAILLPIIFPMVIPSAPSRLDVIFTTNSGAEVPKATIVSPITISETLSFFASEDAPSTSKSAPFTRMTNPIIKRTIVIRVMGYLKKK